MHPTNGSPSSKSTSMPATSMLRPRTRRLISIEDELNPPSAYVSDSDRASPYGSRAASPSPGRAGNPSRTGLNAQPASSFARSASVQASKGSSVLSGLWGNSWSAIQGLATNVLGNEAQADASSPATRRRKPLPAAHRRTSSSAPPKQWGPSSSSSAHVGAGTDEDRESLVRAMKRRDLLTANEHLVPDAVGRIKRRNSDERLSCSAPPSENEDRDALVYIHNVRPQDTLAGISIRFNCQAAVLRKANRMWPNDSVQTKKTLVIPVDACGVKGRPVAGPDAHQEDLLLGEWGNSTDSSPLPDSSSLPNGWHASRPHENDNTSIVSSSLSTTDSETPWKHDSWVLLPNDTEPTQIGRMPRRALGFFPPARRKSLVYSDASTPRASLDVPRPSTTSSPTQSIAARPRASSNLSTLSASAAAAHPRHRSTSAFLLHGPGGVGTLGKNVRSPGPAQDGLNKLFAQHLPSVEPPPDQEYFTPWAPSLLAADDAVAASQHGGGATPLGGPDLSLQEIGGAIEGWVRKVGGQASKLLSEPSTPGQGRRSAVPVLGAVGGDLGDLIELRDDAFEVGDGQGESERGRVGRASEQYQSAREDFHLLLRGRTAKGAGAGGGGGKND